MNANGESGHLGALPETRDALFKEAVRKSGYLDLTIQELLSYWGAKRRGERIVQEIERDLRAANLVTHPSFKDGWINARVALVPVGTSRPGGRDSVSDAAEAALPQVSLRVRSLESANREVVSVLLDDSLEYAQSLMMSKDYSQLAVVSGPRNLRGAISWESIAHARMTNSEAGLREAVFRPEVVRPDDDLLAQIPKIADAGFALVEQSDRQICGIVTTADLSLLFGVLAKPFFVLAEVEGRLRRIIDAHFTEDDLAGIVDPADSKRVATRASDLTLGEVVRLLEEPERWSRLGWKTIERRIFIHDLKEVQGIRNEVLHFSPDPLDEEQINNMELFLKWLRKLDPDP